MDYRLSDDGKILTWVDKDVETFIIPDSVEIINRAFEHCVYLKSIEAPNVIQLEDCAFDNCVSLIDVNIPNVIQIGFYVFHNCHQLEYLSFPKLEKIVNYGAFNSCTKLKEINIPNVSELEDDIFRYDINLYNINSSLSKEQLRKAFGMNDYYNEYIQRNREYKLKLLKNGL